METASWFLLDGWAHPVRTDPLGSCYAGAHRIGAEVAEREGLFWSGLWRLTQDCVTPTLFCVDSQVTGAQAVGQTGALEPDVSYRLLRGVFQCLQFGLPAQHLGIHHVRSHTGDPYNECVDHIAKMGAKQSFNLPRMRLDMQKWIKQDSVSLATLWGEVRTTTMERWFCCTPSRPSSTSATRLPKQNDTVPKWPCIANSVWPR